jgi:hypothetical protein
VFLIEIGRSYGMDINVGGKKDGNFKITIYSKA